MGAVKIDWRRIKITAIAFAAILVVCGLFLYRFFEYRFSPGKSPEETAHILIQDLVFGMRAREKAIEYGDLILPPLIRESKNFQELNTRNSFWIAEVLGEIKTEKCRTILNDLYSRSETLTKLTAAIAMARQGLLQDPGATSLLIAIVQNDTDETETQLAIIALGWTRRQSALTCLLELLKNRSLNYWHHAYACEAVARIDAPEAIPALRDCLRSEGFFALPEAFRALVTLGDIEAVPLAIERISPKIRDFNSGFIVDELEEVTGKSFGYDQDRWMRWWQEVKDTWKLPSSLGVLGEDICPANMHAESRLS